MATNCPDVKRHYDGSTSSAKQQQKKHTEVSRSAGGWLAEIRAALDFALSVSTSSSRALPRARSEVKLFPAKLEPIR